MIIEAILKINPNAEVTVHGNDIDTCTIIWNDNTTPISKEDIKTKINQITYIEKRRDEYPSIVDQLDDIYHNGIDGWKATIKVTKDNYPK